MEKLKYKIGLLTYFQEELTFGQDARLINLYARMKNKSGELSQLRIKDLPEFLIKNNLMEKFFGIILKPKWNVFYLFSFAWFKYLLKGEIHLPGATNTQIGEIFEDFFLLNRKYVTILKGYLNSMGLIAAKMEETKMEKVKI